MADSDAAPPFQRPFLVRLRNPRFGDLQVFVLLFSQAISAQLAFYPLVLLSILEQWKKAIAWRGSIAGAALICCVALSILLRNGSAELMVKLLQFYFGVALVLIAFALNEKLKIGPGLAWFMAAFVFYEVVSYTVFGVTPFIYMHPDLADGAAGIANIGSGLVRAYGPAINASVSGSVLAILFFYVRRNSSQDGSSPNARTTLSAAVLLAFVLCGSITSFAIFAFLLMHSLMSGTRRWKSGKTVLTHFPIALIVIGFGLLLSAHFFSEFASALIETKFNFDYVDFVLNLKAQQLSAIGSPMELLFGADLTSATAGEVGGDFVMLDAILKVGLLSLIGLFAILFRYCPRQNRIYLFAGLLSSIHYGTVFTLFGQAFFGALCANGISLATACRRTAATTRIAENA